MRKYTQYIRKKFSKNWNDQKIMTIMLKVSRKYLKKKRFELLSVPEYIIFKLLVYKQVHLLSNIS